jgi:cytochrome c oxidase cbb3-type subunit 4
MKFINYLESITGIGIFPLISLLIFFIFFTGLSLWAFRADKGYIRALKHIPFPDENDQPSL